MVYPGDNDIRPVYTVVSRTASYVTLTGENDRRCKVHVRTGEEFCYPDGRYSMCPVLSAARLKTGAASKPSTPAKVKPKLPTSNMSKSKTYDMGKLQEIWLNGSDERNRQHGIKAKIDVDGRVNLYRTSVSESMPLSEVLSITASSRKNPVIKDMESTVHGSIVTRHDALLILQGRTRKEKIDADVNRRGAFTLDSVTNYARKAYPGKVTVRHALLNGASGDSNRYEIEMEAKNGAFATISLVWSPIGRWIYDANVGVKRVTGLIHKYPNKVVYSYLDFEAYLKETRKALDDAEKERSRLDIAQKKPSRSI